jgi:hypothetical protein
MGYVGRGARYSEGNDCQKPWTRKKTTTDIYIKFNRKKIDEANRKVIDYVLYEKKPG